MLEIWEVFQTTEFFNRRLLEEEMCYENKYEPFDLYLLSEQQEKKSLTANFHVIFSRLQLHLNAKNSVSWKVWQNWS